MVSSTITHCVCIMDRGNQIPLWIGGFLYIKNYNGAMLIQLLLKNYLHSLSLSWGAGHSYLHTVIHTKKKKKKRKAGMQIKLHLGNLLPLHTGNRTLKKSLPSKSSSPPRAAQATPGVRLFSSPVDELLGWKRPHDMDASPPNVRSWYCLGGKGQVTALAEWHFFLLANGCYI